MCKDDDVNGDDDGDNDKNDDDDDKMLANTYIAFTTCQALF